MNTDTIDKCPLVSIGIPTYNRPQGLKRTLKCITGQTYQHLEIIVSDNCSPDEETQKVVAEFMKSDSRIQYCCQEENRGIEFNFKFVLKKASGEFFMWAADDDKWDKYFIEKCVSNIRHCSSVMCKISTVYHMTGEKKEGELPDLSPDYSVYQNLRTNVSSPSPSLIYGLHRRRDILWLLDFDGFDFADCFFISKLIVDGNGISLIRDYCGYYACITETERYSYKSYKPEKNRCFQYRPYIKSHFQLISNYSGFSCIERLSLKFLVLWRCARWFTKYEKHYKPFKVKFIKIILRQVKYILKFLKAFKKPASYMKNMIFPTKEI